MSQRKKKDYKQHLETVRELLKTAGRHPGGRIKAAGYDQRTAGRVEAMAAMGLDTREIAVMLDLRPGQVREIYGRDLECMRATVHMAVAMRMLDDALNHEDWRAAQFWLKAKAGWQETNVTEHTGKVTLEELVAPSEREEDE